MSKNRLGGQARIALLGIATLAMASLSAQAEEPAMPVYGGTIYTVSAQSDTALDLAYSKLTETTFADGSFTLGETAIGPNNWNTVKNYIANQNAKHTLRFGSTYASSPKTAVFTFAPFSVAGFVVEADSTCEAIVNSGTIDADRRTYIGKAGLTAGTTVAKDFAINLSSSTYGTTEGLIQIAGDQAWTVAAEKTFTLNVGTSHFVSQAGSLTIGGAGTVNFASELTSSGEIAVTDTATLNLVKAASFGTLNVTGGSVTLGGTTSFADTVVVGNGGSLDLSNVTVVLGGDGENAENNKCIANAGTVIVTGGADGTKFELGNLVDSDPSNPDVRVYRLVVNSGAGAIQCVGELTSANFLNQGIAISDRKTVVFDAEAGTVSISGAVWDMTWAGGASGTWDLTSAVWTHAPDTATPITFQNGDNATLATADAAITVAEPVEVSDLTVAANATLTATSANTLKMKTISVQEGAALTLPSSTAFYSWAGSAVLAEGASIRLLDVVAGSNYADKFTGGGTVELALGEGNGKGVNLAGFEGTVYLNGTGSARSRLQMNLATLAPAAKIRVSPTGDLVFNGTGTQVANSVKFDGSSTIFANSSCSGTISGLVTATADRTTATKNGGGSLLLSGGAAIRTLTNLGGGVLTLNPGSNHATAGSRYAISSVGFSGNSTLETVGFDYSFDEVTVNANVTATVKLANANGVLKQSLTIKSLHGSGTLTLESNCLLGDTAPVYFLLGDGSNTATADFTGTITVKNTADSGTRYSSLRIADECIAQKAVISFERGQQIQALYVAGPLIKIGGLATTGTGTFKVISKEATVGDSRFVSDTTRRTLEICTAAGASPSYAGAIMANVNLVKSGAGTQTLTGVSEYFNGSVTVREGVLQLGAGASLGTGAITVEPGATLAVQGSFTSGLVTVAEGATLNLVGTADGRKLASGKFSIAKGATVTLDGKPVRVTVGADGLYKSGMTISIQ